MAYDEQLAERIRRLTGEEPALTEKKMFGGLAFLVNSNMAIAASGQGGIMIRCAPEDTDALLREPGAEHVIMRGRAMNGWLRVRSEAVADDGQLEPWVARALDYARRLPRK